MVKYLPKLLTVARLLLTHHNITETHMSCPTSSSLAWARAIKAVAMGAQLLDGGGGGGGGGGQNFKCFFF